MPAPRTWLLAPALLALVACYAPQQTPPTRGALEQQVVAEAIRATVDMLHLKTLGLSPEGRYAVTVSGLRGTDRGWVKACLEQRLIRNGFRVVQVGAEEPGEDGSPVPRVGVERTLPAGVAGVTSARITRLEAAVAYAGYDLERSLIGFPLIVPGLPVAFGSLSLYESTTVTGRARIGLRAWDGPLLLVALPEVQESRYHRVMTYLTVLGPFRSTDVPTWSEPGDEQHRDDPPPGSVHVAPDER